MICETDLLGKRGQRCRSLPSVALQSFLNATGHLCVPEYMNRGQDCHTMDQRFLTRGALYTTIIHGCESVLHSRWSVVVFASV